MSQILRQSTQVVVRIGPFVDVTDAFTPETGVTLTGGGDNADEAEALKAAGAATADISANTWAAITGCDGWYNLTLSTSNTDTVGTLDIVIQNDSVHLPVYARFQVIEEALFDGIYAASAAVVPANTTQIAGSAVSTSTAQIGVNIVNAAGTAWGSGGITAASIAASALNGKGDWNVGKTGYALTATTGLGNQTADITGSLSGSVGSVTGAVGSVTGAVGSVTGNVGGNVVGSVASVTGTIGGLSAAALADFFDTNSGTTYGAAVAGSVVKEIADNAGGSALTEAGIADAVWDEARAGHVAAGSFGEGIASVQGNVTGSVASVTGAVGSVTGLTASNLDATISSRLASASYTAPDNTSIAAILVDTAEIGAAGAGLTALATAANLTTVDTVVDAIKAKTDSLTFSVANQVDANIKSVTNTAVTGAGTEADPWGP